MAMIPLLVARLIIEAVEDEMSDIQYLAIKEFEGKLRQDNGTLSATGDLATLTANAGKDMYLGSAKITFRRTNNSTGAYATGVITLSVNGIVKDTCNFAFSGAASTSNDAASLTFGTYDFPVGFKVTTTQIIKLEVTSLDVNVNVTGEIQCFEEDTGTTPQIPPLEPV